MRHYAAKYGLERVALVGYSMGGNLVLKLAGEWGKRSAALRGGNGLSGYRSRSRFRCSARAGESAVRVAFSARADAALPSQGCAVSRTSTRSSEHWARFAQLRQFDDKIVARYCGFRDADDYYYRAASARVVDSIAVPTLIHPRGGRPIHSPVARNPRGSARESQRSAGRDAARRSLRISYRAIAATTFIGPRPA